MLTIALLYSFSRNKASPSSVCNKPSKKSNTHKNIITDTNHSKNQEKLTKFSALR